MANREKKISIGGKKPSSLSLSSSPLPPSPVPSATNEESVTTPTNEEAPKLTPIKNTKVSRKIKKPVSKKIINKALGLTPKPRGRPKKINTLINDPNKSVDVSVKKVRIRNGVKKTLVKKVKQEDDGPPVLEPIFPVEVNEKKRKKRVKTEYDSTSDMSEISTKVIKPRKKKIKLDNNDKESIEDVMNDLKNLIKTNDMKQDSDSVVKVVTKKRVRKPKLDTPKKRSVKKINTEANLSPIDTNSKLIDTLDLNVNKVKKVTKKIRRHSIEKIPLEKNDPNTKVPNIFSNMPRSVSPKGKRGPKPKQSLEHLTSKRQSPYRTRSDLPSRILRNGKHTKLKDAGLFDGVDVVRRRRRLCSDYSGSEISISKLSGYESDSSFSDLASVGNIETAERECDTKIEVKKEILDTITDLQENLNIDMNEPIKVKKSLSTETTTNGSLDDNFMDTNSNLCTDNKDSDTSSNTKVINPLYNPALAKDLNLKVPEKSIILDIMKHKFNENVSLKETSVDKEETILKVGEEDEEDVIENLEEINEKTTTEEINEEALLQGSASEEETGEETLKLEELSVTKFYGNEDSVESELVEEIENSEKLQETEALENRTVDGIEEEEEADTEEEPEEMKTQADSLPNEQIQMEVKSDIVDSQIDKTENSSNNVTETLESTTTDSQEDLTVKENILQALGLQSLRAAEEAKQKQKEKVTIKNDNYTGTLKTVIKLNRLEKKKGRNPVKMTLQKTKKSSSTSAIKEQEDFKCDDDVYKIMKEVRLNNNNL